MKNLRYLQHNFRARIENNLVLTRIGELSIRVLNALTRGLLFNISPSVKAIFIEGLGSTHNSGFLIDVAVPAVVVQNAGDGIVSPDVSFAADENLQNGAVDFQITIPAPDPTLDRIDIIEGQIKTRSEFTDTAVDIVDPVTQVVTPSTFDRDFEVYLDIRQKSGTPAASPVPPSTTAAAAGILLGTVTTDVLDLSTQYLINIAVGADSEFVEIDMRGAVPSATTRAERISVINGAGFGTIAANVGGAIQITSPGIGQNSLIRVKSPIQSSKDAYTLVFGVSTTLGYLDIYQGENAWFKISEIFVPQAAVSLVPANVRSRENKDTEWDSDANTVENAFSFDGHRLSDPMDHIAGSVKFFHLDPAIAGELQDKLTLFRDPGIVLYGSVKTKPTLFYDRNVAAVTAIGDDQDPEEIEQEYPVNRVDQRQDTTGGPGYPVPTVLSELVADKHLFTPGALINDGTQYYQIKDFEENHNRIGVYITNGASIANFTHMRITLHNAADSSLGFVDIPFADLQSVGIGWIYADLPATVVNGLSFHYHFSLVGAAAETRPILATDSFNDLTFREMYLPDAGKYGSASQADVVNLINPDGSDLVSARSSGDDDIVSPGDGFIGVSGYDVMVEDFSDNSYWSNWKYQDYIGIDMAIGKIKLPSSLNKQNLFVEFNTKEGVLDQDGKNYLRHTSNESLDSSIVRLEDGWTEREITELIPDAASSIFESILGVSEVVVFPETGTPKGKFAVMTRSSGSFAYYPMLFRLRYAMDSSDTGVVKLDFKIYINNTLVATRSITINPPNDTSRASKLTTVSDVYIAGSEITTRGYELYIEISRDNGVGSNHTGKFQLIGMTII